MYMAKRFARRKTRVNKRNCSVGGRRRRRTMRRRSGGKRRMRSRRMRGG